ncbi:MAG: hypothetical protein EA427_01365 [Spirochaetaceae bacterium]|nr:MAG: hypothetical protein EA427_01365 [Spirochaetaceae bacterium]
MPVPIPVLLKDVVDALEPFSEVLASDEFVPLPGQFDFHEYHVMEQFSLQLDDPGLQEELLEVIRGSGAFRRFKALIRTRSIDQDWYAYRERSLRDLAVEFLESEGIPFVDQ